jgi:hypothetical protein
MLSRQKTLQPKIKETAMRKFLLPITLLGLLFVAVHATPAQAQATRTWVSGVGDDVNPCSRTAPCKTFAGAISKTAIAGEINCLDSGGFGTINITKSITLRCKGVIGSILGAGTTGVIINSATAQVLLDGLDIMGANTGTIGIRIIAAQKVWIKDVTISQFLNNGINVESASAHVFVENSFILNNGQAAGTFGGINVAGTSNIANLRNTQILFNGNGATGFALNASSASAAVSLQTTVLNDSTNGISRVGGAQVVCIGPSNVVSGAGTCSSSVPFL